MRSLFLLFFTLSPILFGASVEAKENLPLPQAQFLQLLQHEDFQILSDKATQGGISGARKWKISFPNGPQNVEVKWKPGRKVNGEGWNNSPRREIAAYQFQKLFLDPPDYLVPPTTARCIPLSEYRKLHPKAEANIDNFNCVYGELQAWLQNVEMPNPTYDPKRFESDSRYAYYLANMNLFCYLINHQDGTADNYLISTLSEKPILFSYDNGITFRWEFHNFFISNWNAIRVPSLPRKTIDRLRKVTEADLDRLGVVEQLDPDEKGVLRPVEPRENLSPNSGARLRPHTLQIGLTRTEIEEIKKRLDKLLKEVDLGKWPLF